MSDVCRTFVCISSIHVPQLLRPRSAMMREKERMSLVNGHHTISLLYIHWPTMRCYLWWSRFSLTRTWIKLRVESNEIFFSCDICLSSQTKDRQLRHAGKRCWRDATNSRQAKRVASRGATGWYFHRGNCCNLLLYCFGEGKRIITCCA